MGDSGSGERPGRGSSCSPLKPIVTVSLITIDRMIQYSCIFFRSLSVSIIVAEWYTSSFLHVCPLKPFVIRLFPSSEARVSWLLRLSRSQSPKL